MVITQVVLTWTLLGILVIWMITFIVLAIYPHSNEKVTLEDFPTPSHPTPAVPAPVILHFITSQPLQPHIGAITPESPGDLGATPVV